MELIDYQMELARPYRLWVQRKWFCVDEVTINKYVQEDNTVIYTIEITDYREIERVSAGYKRALYKLERYCDDNAEHNYEKIATFDTLDEATEFVNKKFPAIDIEAELNKYYEDDDDDE